MYETVKRLFLAGKLSADGVENAVIKRWITREEADRLLKMKGKESEGWNLWKNI